jgi:hypothetical protein
MRQERFGKTISVSNVDGLRVESQSVTPQLYEKFKLAGQQAQIGIEAMYGHFIHPRFIAQNASVADRIVVVDDMSLMFERWQQKPRLGMKALHEKGKPYGFSLQDNGIIYIQNPEMLWENSPLESILDFYEGHGVTLNPDQAEDRFYTEFAEQLTTHEVLHQYEDMSLEEGFSEMATGYYQDRISLRFGRNPVAVVPQREVIDAYIVLLQEFGSDVHKLNFNTLKSTKRRNEILDRARIEWWRLIADGIVDPSFMSA